MSTSELRKQWELFCKDNAQADPFFNISYSMFKKSLEKYISDLTFRDYDNLIKEFTSRSIVICPKCKDNNVNWQGVQTRRADEAQTIFCKCLNEDCKYEWRF